MLYLLLDSIYRWMLCDDHCSCSQCRRRRHHRRHHHHHYLLMICFAMVMAGQHTTVQLVIVNAESFYCSCR